MAFSTRRGRPRAALTERYDLGTPELIMKRAYAITSEALDICLERGIITQPQHWCGVHLRWLYTLRYGAPGVRAINLAREGGADIIADDPEWRAEREREYHAALTELKQTKADILLLAVCVHNQRPGFLHGPIRFSTAPCHEQRLTRQACEIALLVSGLDTLCQLWKRREKTH